MANPTVDVTQTKTLSVVFKDAAGNPIVAGGPVVWTITPAAALGLAGTGDLQSTQATGQLAMPNVQVTAKEPVSGFTSATFLMDVAAVQMLISQAVIVLS